MYKRGLFFLFIVIPGLSGVPAFAEGDQVRGAEIYKRCSGCHSLDQNRVGPRHRGLYGRKAGSVDTFTYSEALLTSKIIWDEETLDKWLQNPRKFIPGSRMGFRLSNPADRRDIIAYLRNNSH